MNAMKNNALWTWDSRMQWYVPQRSKALGMAMPDQDFPYPYDEFFFVENYRLLIDEVAEWDPVPKIIVWGFLRDSHGGIRAAQQVAEYAAERGVPLLPGVGTGGYGGVYYEGLHKYHTKCFLEKNPRLIVRNEKVMNGSRVPRGSTVDPLCDEVLDWLADGIHWLCREFPVAGVNLEIGDFFVPESLSENLQESAIQDEFLATLALHYGGLFQRIQLPREKYELSYATYGAPESAKLAKNKGFASALPDEAVCQWTLTDYEEESVAGMLPARNRGYGHYQSLANGSENICLREPIARMVVSAARNGFEGVCMYGEIPASNPSARKNYAVFRQFCANPDLAAAELRDAQKRNFAGLAPA
jgi:hypothetical protein